MNIQQALKASTDKLKQNKIPSASLDAEVLLLEALNKNNNSKYDNINNTKNGIATSLCKSPRNDNNKLDKSWLYINNKYILNKKEENLFNDFINQRLKHKPVAYIINRKEFFGLDFYVDGNVLIPRPETELIVEKVLKILDEQACLFATEQKKITLIDIGTGSGCIIISILNELANRKKNKIIYNAYANDISLQVINVAKINAKKYKLDKKIKFITNNFEDFIKNNKKLFSNQFILTANLPYIKNDEYEKLFPNVKKYEPKNALAGGNDGLVLISKLINLISISKTKSNLNNYIILEADPAQMKKIKSLLETQLNAIDIKIIKDLRGKNRLILAKI